MNKKLINDLAAYFKSSGWEDFLKEEIIKSEIGFNVLKEKAIGKPKRKKEKKK